ncbi:hypothetical protein Y032_0023g681 [Ancylostoma ceylanicum]|uniref:Uncharacterized protein n=1 Tax=Ancylostoma ceylanicum TaxID=53326 RepID=A0A016UWB9_9BILA|nr:hypothetical protein Y032_0023g681 [Ancylostoma ceylanicum]
MYLFSWSPRSKRLQSQKRSHHAAQSQGGCVAATSHLASHGATQRPCDWVSRRLGGDCRRLDHGDHQNTCYESHIRTLIFSKIEDLKPFFLQHFASDGVHHCDQRRLMFLNLENLRKNQEAS